MPSKILVLDDEAEILQLIELILQPHYQVSAFSEPRAALAALEQGLRPELFICDVSMPEISGFEFHEAVRRIMPLRSVPFVYLTALSDREHQRQGMSLGADDYLTKPFKPQELLEAVGLRLARARALQELDKRLSIRSLGGLSISYGGQRVNWEAKKAAVGFLYLLAAGGKALFKEMKAGLWWEPVSENNLYVLNNRLKKATEAFAELSSDGELVRLSLACSYVWDVEVFEQAANKAVAGGTFLAVENALQHYGGEFLSAVDAPWAEQRRVYYEQIYLELLEKSIELAPTDLARTKAQKRHDDFLGLANED